MKTRDSSESIGADKVFAVGLNKTGTTSVEEALAELGYRMGQQSVAERLLKPWLRRDFAPIIEFARGADAFQDIPFSLPFTYQALAEAFPLARFLLTVRSSADQWYRSVVSFMVDDDGNLPTMEALRSDPYRYPGFMYDAQIGVVFGTDDARPFDRDAHLMFYEAHNYMVRSYFQGSDRLLVLNLASPDSYQRMCAFLGRSPRRDVFPHLNASARHEPPHLSPR